MVVGGGIAGIEAALKLAQAGKKVYLVERDPSIGGHMAMFDKTFPTLDCAACILTPKMSAAGKEPHIEMLAYSEVTEVDGYVGNFKVKVTKKARCVDIDKCTGCGLCTEACVVRKVSNEFDQGLSKRSAAYIPFPQAVPLRATIDPVNCLTRKGKKCKQPCVTACGPGAIDFDQKDEEITVEVGAIIMATGFELWDATQESPLQLRPLRRRYQQPRVRAHLQRLRSDRRPHRLQERRGAQVGRHPPLRRQPRRELPGVLLARLLHVLAEVRAPHQGAPARDRGVRVLHRHALLRQGLRGVLPAAHERGRQLHPRTGGRDQRGGARA